MVIFICSQSIFDALSKTLPVLWDDDKIVVMDEILISPPYKPESCALLPGKSAETSLMRIRKVLQGERARLKID